MWTLTVCPQSYPLFSYLFSSLFPASFSSLFSSLHGELWLLPMSLSLAVAAIDLVFVDDIGDVIKLAVIVHVALIIVICSCDDFPMMLLALLILLMYISSHTIAQIGLFFLQQRRCNWGVDDIISDCDVNKQYVLASLGLGVADFVMAAVEIDVFEDKSSCYYTSRLCYGCCCCCCCVVNSKFWFLTDFLFGCFSTIES